MNGNQRSLVCSFYLGLALVLSLPRWVGAFSMVAPAGSADTSYTQDVYFDQSKARYEMDQAAYKSPKFWEELDKEIRASNWKTSPHYERFRGFCDNLRNEEPGKEVFMPNGQQLLAQYVFPGIDDTQTPRSAYPANEYEKLSRVQRELSEKVQRTARKEFAGLLEKRPLVSDDAESDLDGNDGDTWQRAAWYGWQFLPMRGAKRFMPKTMKALNQAMGKLGPAHRFVGMVCQKHNCTGTVHSDGRNYMLSTLTPVVCPPGCGIIVDGIDRSLSENPVILDNTFPHYVYNQHESQDRFCLMSELYHPALTPKEIEAISTLFAVKDRFTVKELRLAPWGYDDDGLEAALSTGLVDDLDFFKEIGFDHAKAAKKKARGQGSAKGFGR